MVEPVLALVIGCLLLAVMATGMAAGALAMRAALRRSEGPKTEVGEFTALEADEAALPVAKSPPLNQVLRCMNNSGVLVFDHLMRVRSSDGEALSLLGLPHNRNEGETLLWQSLPKEVMRRLESTLRHALHGEPGEVELSVGNRLVRLSCGPLTEESGAVSGVIAVLQPATSWTEAKSESDEAAQFNSRQMAELVKRNRALQEMASTAANDLREPLRTAATHLTLVRRRAKQQLDPQSRAHLILADDGIRRAERTILDILDYATLGESRPRERVALAEVLALALRDLSTKVEETGASIDIIDALPTVHGVRGQLHRLFLNLLSNALRHRPMGAVPVIRIGCVEDGGMWKITVADNGSGIEHPQREKVFEPLRRLARTQPGPSGSGMGLAIARRIVEIHGGRIWIEGPGEAISGGTFQGCTFSLTLSAAKPNDSLIRLSPAQAAGVKS